MATKEYTSDASDGYFKRMHAITKSPNFRHLGAPATRLLLAYLCFADAKTGRAWPSLDELGRRAFGKASAHAQVLRARRKLEAAGYLRIVEEGAAGGAATVVEVAVPEGCAAQPCDEAGKVAPRNAKGCAPIAERLRPRSRKVARAQPEPPTSIRQEPPPQTPTRRGGSAGAGGGKEEGRRRATEDSLVQTLREAGSKARDLPALVQKQVARYGERKVACLVATLDHRVSVSRAEARLPPDERAIGVLEQDPGAFVYGALRKFEYEKWAKWSDRLADRLSELDYLVDELDEPADDEDDEGDAPVQTRLDRKPAKVAPVEDADEEEVDADEQALRDLAGDFARRGVREATVRRAVDRHDFRTAERVLNIAENRRRRGKAIAAALASADPIAAAQKWKRKKTKEAADPWRLDHSHPPEEARHAEGI